jgi:hypothetical protein
MRKRPAMPTAGSFPSCSFRNSRVLANLPGHARIPDHSSRSGHTCLSGHSRTTSHSRESGNPGFRGLPLAAGILKTAASLLAVLVLLAAQPLAAAPAKAPGLSISARPGSVPVGGTFELTMRCTLPAGAKMSSPPAIKGLESLRVVKRGVSDGRIVLTILADNLDPITVGPLELGYTDSAGRAGSLRSGWLRVAVSPGLKGQEELEPIKGIIPALSPWIRWAAYLLAAAAALAALAGIVYAWKRWKRRGDAPGPADPPHVRAEKELQALLRENLFEQGRQKEFYFRFTEIVKRYLEALRVFPAAEYTTEEIAGRVLEADRPVLSILRFADLVKFSDQAADQCRKEGDVSAFQAYLDVTAPRADEQGPGQGEGRP